MKEKAKQVAQWCGGKKKQLIGILSLVLVVGVLMGFAAPGMGGGNRAAAGSEASTVRTVTLEKGEIQSTVSATGTVYSTSSVNVYSNLNYNVQAIHVEVGDVIAEGDLLAELDTTSLETDISQKQAQVWASQSTAQQNLKTAQQDLENYQNNLERERESTILSAEKALSTAEANLAAAELEVQSAKIEYDTAWHNYRDAKDEEDDYEDDEDYDDSYVRDLRNTYRQKQIALEKAQNTLATREADLETAIKELEIAQNKTGETLQTYQDKVTSAKLNNNYSADYISIQKLEGDLEDCKILAPAAGTVTAVNAIEGGSGSGLLFVIQDTDELKVLTNIKEYDVGSVKVGDRVVIKTDATGDTEFEGTLTRIAPTSTLTASGEATSSTDAEFEAEVTVDRGTKGLRIGMNTRLSIITEEHKDIFSVPFEAVETVGGTSAVYAAITEEGAVSYQRIPVETGLESNLYVEISGEGLAEGMEIVKNASAVDASLVAGGLPENPAAEDAPAEMPEQGEFPGGRQGGGPPTLSMGVAS